MSSRQVLPVGDNRWLVKEMFKLRLLLNDLPVFHENRFEICGQIVGIVGTVLDKTVEKSAYLGGAGGIFSKLRSRPILPSPPPPGSSVVGSSKESRIPKYLWEATLNWGRGFFYAELLIWK